MAVAVIGAVRSGRAQFARDARLARAWALLVDTIVFGILTLLVNNVYGVTQITSGSAFGSASGFTRYTSETVVSGPWLILLALLYFMVSEAHFGATPGKYWAGLRVVRVDGRPLNLRAVVIRNLLKPIDWVPAFYLLGATSALVTTNSQRLGDLAAGTTVVYRHRALEPGVTRTATRHVRRALGLLVVAAALFTVAFNYFGRPPLVIQGMVNTGQLLSRPVASYSLGDARWGWGTVTYPFKAGLRDMNSCSGTVTLQWYGLGWTESSSGASCQP